MRGTTVSVQVLGVDDAVAVGEDVSRSPRSKEFVPLRPERRADLGIEMSREEIVEVVEALEDLPSALEYYIGVRHLRAKHTTGKCFHYSDDILDCVDVCPVEHAVLAQDAGCGFRHISQGIEPGCLGVERVKRSDERRQFSAHGTETVLAEDGVAQRAAGACPLPNEAFLIDVG